MIVNIEVVTIPVLANSLWCFKVGFPFGVESETWQVNFEREWKGTLLDIISLGHFIQSQIVKYFLRYSSVSRIDQKWIAFFVKLCIWFVSETYMDKTECLNKGYVLS